MTPSFEVTLTEATAPLALALDVGSTASRGMLYDAHGRPAGSRAKRPHAFATAADGTSEIDADEVLGELTQIIDELCAQDVTQISGVALDTFASSLVVLDAKLAPITPCFTYADSRNAHEAEVIRREHHEEDLQQLTGTRIHTSYWPARLRWLAATRPEVLASAAHIVSLGDYVLLKLTGALATGTSSAAWTGMLDRHTASWAPEMIALSGVDAKLLPPIHHLDAPLEPTRDHQTRIAQRWPALAGASWFATIADGLAANVGLGASTSVVMGGSCATSGALRVLVNDAPARLPTGLWCYRVSHDRSLVGGAMNDVGRALAWAEGAFGLDTATVHAAFGAPCHAETPLVLPFFTGERSTGWASKASALFQHVTAETTPAQLYRGVAEGIALSYRRIAGQLREIAPDVAALHMGGRVASDHPELLGLVAGALDTPVTPVTMKRSTLHGTALLALETLAPGVSRAEPDAGDTCTPHPDDAAYFADRAARFESTYRANV